MEIILTDQTAKLPDQFDEKIIKIAEHVSKHLRLGDNVEVSIIIVDNETIHQINKEARGKDMPTDVISFALEDDESDLDIFEQLHDELPLLLGDIYISLDKVYEQAEEYEHSPETELAYLVVHGLLHLNGYDHHSDEEASEMFGLQTKILSELGYEA